MTPAFFRHLFVGIFPALALILGGGCRAGTGRVAVTHLVRIEGMTFSPETIVVRRGDTVDFLNADLVPHTATSQGSVRFDSGPIEAQRRWSYRAEAVGIVPYRCTFHPSMTGSVKVLDEAAPVLARNGRTVEWCGGDAVATRLPLVSFLPLPGILSFR